MRGEPIGSVVVIRLNEAGQAARIVVNHRPLGSVLLWSKLMGEHFAGTRSSSQMRSRTGPVNSSGRQGMGTRARPPGRWERPARIRQAGDVLLGRRGGRLLR